jgi:hypothetical protein
MTSSSLLLANGSRTKLIEMIKENNSGIILTAFFSEFAGSWLEELNVKDLILVVRGRVEDFLSGATSLKALAKLSQLGVTIKFNFDLHAKIFCFGDEILLGSSNLTANGFHLLTSNGNIELNNIIKVTDQDMAIIEKIVFESKLVNAGLLNKIEKFLDNQLVAKPKNDMVWPNNFFVEEKLILDDLPVFNFKDSIEKDTTQWGELARLLSRGENQSASLIFQQFKIISWLRTLLLKTHNRGIRFGEITDKIHNELSERYSITRKDLKLYQANLYSFIRNSNLDIYIERPNISEILHLRK